jgi:hypothetical protein
MLHTYPILDKCQRPKQSYSQLRTYFFWRLCRVSFLYARFQLHLLGSPLSWLLWLRWVRTMLLPPLSGFNLLLASVCRDQMWTVQVSDTGVPLNIASRHAQALCKEQKVQLLQEDD